MPFKQMPEERLEDMLKRQPLWEPPPDFAQRVVARASTVRDEWPVMQHGFTLLRAAGAGLTVATVVYIAGSRLLWSAPAIVDRAVTAGDRYAMFVELATGMLIANSTAVALICVAFSLSLAVTVTRRALT